MPDRTCVAVAAAQLLPQHFSPYLAGLPDGPAGPQHQNLLSACPLDLHEENARRNVSAWPDRALNRKARAAIAAWGETNADTRCLS